MKATESHRFWPSTSPLIIIAAVVVLLPIITLMTIQSINRQKKDSIRLLVEKGAALIRSFEAGTRTGMRGEPRGTFKLQLLITETAQQADIDYIYVTDNKGVILAASNPDQIGSKHAVIDPLNAAPADERIQWRQVSGDEGKKVFEVFRKFAPFVRTGHPLGPGPPHHGRMMQRQLQLSEFLNTEKPGKPGDLRIYVGLDMASIDEGRKADTWNAIVMGVILLVVGFTGFVLIFFFQSYRATRTSLSRIKAFSENLVDNMPTGLIALDDAQQIITINKAACDILGVSNEQARQTSAQQLLPESMISRVSRIYGGADSIEEEIDCRLANGTTLPLAVSLSRLVDENGMFLGGIILFKDLSEMRALRKEVARGQRLASIGKLAAGVAHEIRNPLSSIKGFATYFKEKAQKNEDDQKIANIMIQEVDRLNRVVSQLLELTKPVPIHAKPVDLIAVIQQSLDRITLQAKEKKIDVQIQAVKPVAPIFLDPDQFNQVLLNLYLNAIEAMGTDGTLCVTLEEGENQRGAWVRVSDTGSGISADHQALIFDPYFTTKTSGTGLGLAIAHNIIEAHKGRIEVESRIAEGTRISIFLPYGEQPQAAAKRGDV